jgi:hypothetical protein
MRIALALFALVIIGATFWLADEHLAPLWLNSRIERLGEAGLPKIIIEKGPVLHCRMKADDFRFPLPVGSRVTNAIVSGGFDTADGSVEARFDGTNVVTADQYQSWLSGKVPAGGQIEARSISGGLLIKFHYFGDK